MRYLLVLFMLLATRHIHAQCECGRDPAMSQTIDCDERKLSDGSKLYYQFNCDSVWLVLENTSGVKHIIYADPKLVELELYGYLYRLGYQLVREYKKSLLFRYGCPANGPCNFVLVDKNTGKKIEEFDHLIYGELVEDDENIASAPRDTSFIMYFGDTLSKVVLHYIDTDKRYTFDIDPKEIEAYAVHPAFFFSVPIFSRDKVMTITYGDNRYWNKQMRGDGRAEEGVLVIDLKIYKP